MSNYPHVQLYIDGHWREGAAARKLPVLNPATGELMGELACAETADLEEVAEAANRGFDVWRKISAFDRYKMMRKAAQLLRDRVETVAQLMTMEQGKPLAEARMEVMAGADTIDWFAEEGRRAYGRVIPARQMDVYQLVIKEPVGPVAAFTPVASIPAGDHDGFLTPRFTAEYKLSEITLLYGSVAKAGKPSGVSTTGAASGGFDPELFRFGAESMWVYEVGQKSTFNDGKGKINLDGYYQDFANKQVSTQIVRSNGLLGTRTVNAGGARVYGAELELGYAPTRDLNLNLAYSYIDSKYTNYVTTGAGPGVIATVGNCKVVTLPTVPSPTTTCELDRSVDELENVSRHSLVLSGSYTIPISGDMNWRFDTDVRYQDDRFADTENLLLLPGYWNVDLRAGIETDTWDITAYANNLFNDRTVKTAFPFTDFGTLRVVPFPPPFTVVLNNGLQSGLPDKRQLGLRAKYRF